MLLFISCELPELEKLREPYKGRLNLEYVYTNKNQGEIIFWNTGILKGPIRLPKTIDGRISLNDYYFWGYFSGTNDTLFVEQYGSKGIISSMCVLSSDTSFIWIDNIGSIDFIADKSLIKPDSSKLSFYCKIS